MAYVPSSAQLVNMTQNVEERASIIGIKEVFYNIGVVLVSSLFLPMVALFGNGSESRGSSLPLWLSPLSRSLRRLRIL